MMELMMILTLVRYPLEKQLMRMGVHYSQKDSDSEGLILTILMFSENS